MNHTSMLEWYKKFLSFFILVCFSILEWVVWHQNWGIYKSFSIGVTFDMNFWELLNTHFTTPPCVWKISLVKHQLCLLLLHVPIANMKYSCHCVDLISWFRMCFLLLKVELCQFWESFNVHTTLKDVTFWCLPYVQCNS